MTKVEEFNKVFLEVYNSNFNSQLKYMTHFAHGMCYYYAYCFEQCLGGQVVSYLCPYKKSGHCFIRYEGRFFDAENSEGQENWKDLQRYLKKVRRPLHRNSKLGILSLWKVSSKEKQHWVKMAESMRSKLGSSFK